MLGLSMILLLTWFFHKKQPIIDIHENQYDGFIKHSNGLVIITFLVSFLLTVGIAAGIVFLTE